MTHKTKITLATSPLFHNLTTSKTHSTANIEATCLIYWRWRPKSNLM